MACAGGGRRVLDFLGLVLAKLTHDVVSLRFLLFAMVDRSAYSCISLRCSSRSKSSMCHFRERRPAARRVGKLMSEVRAGDPGASASQSSKARTSAFPIWNRRISSASSAGQSLRDDRR
jgi:hypothetical protein